MIVRLAVAAAVAIALAGPAEAANCKKGKPCGGSCIARDKVCRIGSPAPPASGKAAAREPGVFDRTGTAVVESTRHPPEIRCRWSGKVYRVPAALCRDGGGWVVE